MGGRPRPGDGAHPPAGGGRGGQAPGEQPQVVVHPDFVRPELHHPAVAGGGGQVGRPPPGHAGHGQPPALGVAGEQVLLLGAQYQPGQGEQAGYVHRHLPTALPAPVRCGGEGGQRQAAAQHSPQGHGQRQQRQNKAQRQQKVGQVVFVGDLEQQRPGQCQGVYHAAQGHGAHRRRGAGTEASTSPAIWTARRASRADPAGSTSRWAMASVQI